MTTTIAQRLYGDRSKNQQDEILHILEAVNTNDSNTRKQCQLLVEKLSSWLENGGEIIIYGDASNQRRTETANVNDTNWTIVKEYFPNAEYKVPTVNPNIKERCNWVNAKIKNYAGDVGIFFNNTMCQAMIRDMEQVIWAPDGKTKDGKTNKMLTHNSDNLDYLVAKEFPMKYSNPVQSIEPPKIKENKNKIFS